MGPTCLFRRSQRVVERRRVCVVELAIGPFSILVFYTICLLLAERNEFRRERLPSVAAVGID